MPTTSPIPTESEINAIADRMKAFKDHEAMLAFCFFFGQLRELSRQNAVKPITFGRVIASLEKGIALREFEVRAEALESAAANG